MILHGAATATVAGSEHFADTHKVSCTGRISAHKIQQELQLEEPWGRNQDVINMAMGQYKTLSL